MALKSENPIYTMIKANRPLRRKGELIRYPSTDPKNAGSVSYEPAKTETVAPKPIPSPLPALID